MSSLDKREQTEQLASSVLQSQLQAQMIPDSFKPTSQSLLERQLSQQQNFQTRKLSVIAEE